MEPASPPSDDRRHIEVRVYGDLRDLADVDRSGLATVPVGEPRSIKDLVESLGVPHTEVDVVVAGGEPVGWDHRVASGERIAVYPPFASLDVGASVQPPLPEPPRFLLDVHLGRLARRLRTLGFDAAYERDADDQHLAERAAAERRILLSRDRGLLMRRIVRHGYLPRSDDPDQQALEVVRRFRLVDRLDPFSRCIRCNGRLDPVAKADVLDELPPRTRVEHDRFVRCRRCDQVFWPGTHHEHLRGFVAWIRAAATPTGSGGA